MSHDLTLFGVQSRGSLASRAAIDSFTRRDLIEPLEAVNS
jgi:hypothetical protein